ncbi:hypothetical protein C8R44DRAFT_880966 [Mycena epipterygia]|nr:hypothetical protein C8R44DRAFT_880966 [Mycena epipterygia]
MISPGFFKCPCADSPQVPSYYSPKPSFIDGVSDQYVALAAPVIGDWLLALVFDTSIHATSRNLVSRTSIVWTIIIQHLLQTILELTWMGNGHTPVINHAEEVSVLSRWLGSVHESSGEVQPFLSAVALHLLVGCTHVQVLFGIFAMDTWQYFDHRYLHTNQFLYRHFHSWHHRIYVPYAIGAI